MMNITLIKALFFHVFTANCYYSGKYYNHGEGLSPRVCVNCTCDVSNCVILYQTTKCGLVKIEPFEENKLYVQNMKFLRRRVENYVGKGENADYHYFLLFAQCFRKPLSSRSFKIGTVQ